MHKQWFNHYKYKKRVTRWWGSSTHASRDMAGPGIKDFAWHARKQNPFYRDPRMKRTNWRRRAAVAAFVICGAGSALILLFHPFFHTREIVVTGTERLAPEDIRGAVSGIIAYKRLFFLPGENYFLIREQEIADILLQRFPLAAALVNKKFPRQIMVHVEERISTVIYDNGKEYAYVGSDGKVVEVLRRVGEDEWSWAATNVSPSTSSTPNIGSERIHVPSSETLTQEMGRYPIVYDTRETPTSGLKVNDVVLDKDLAKGIIQWFSWLEKKTDIPYAYMLLGAVGVGEGEIVTGEGWRLLVRLESEQDAQYEALASALRDYIQDKRPNQLTYVDVRFPRKVFWK